MMAWSSASIIKSKRYRVQRWTQQKKEIVFRVNFGTIKIISLTWKTNPLLCITTIMNQSRRSRRALLLELATFWEWGRIHKLRDWVKVGIYPGVVLSPLLLIIHRKSSTISTKSLWLATFMLVKPISYWDAQKGYMIPILRPHMALSFWLRQLLLKIANRELKPKFGTLQVWTNSWTSQPLITGSQSALFWCMTSLTSNHSWTLKNGSPK